MDDGGVVCDHHTLDRHRGYLQLTPDQPGCRPKWVTSAIRIRRNAFAIGASTPIISNTFKYRGEREPRGAWVAHTISSSSSDSMFILKLSAKLSILNQFSISSDANAPAASVASHCTTKSAPGSTQEPRAHILDAVVFHADPSAELLYRIHPNRPPVESLLLCSWWCVLSVTTPGLALRAPRFG